MSSKSVRNVIVRRGRSALPFWIGLVLGCVALLLAAQGVDARALFAVLARTDPFWAMVAVLSVVITTLAKTARWRLLFHARRSHLRFSRLLSILLIGQMANFLTSVRLGEPVRAYLVGQVEGESKAYALTTVAVEKLADLLMLLALVLILPWLNFPLWIQVARWTVALGVGLLGAGALLAAYQRARLESAAKWMLARTPWSRREGLFSAFQGALAGAGVVRDRSAVVKIMVWTLGIWVLATATNYAVFRALHLHLDWPEALFLLAVLQAGMSVPSTPGKVGVFQYLCIIALAPFGVGRAEAFAYGILLYAAVFGTMALWVAFTLWRYGMRWSDLSASTAQASDDSTPGLEGQQRTV